MQWWFGRSRIFRRSPSPPCWSTPKVRPRTSPWYSSTAVAEGQEHGRQAAEDPRHRGQGGQLKRWELGKFVAAEVRRLGTRMPDDAAELLVESLGEDLRALSAAGSSSRPTRRRPIAAEDVPRYFGGRAEVKGFAVADAALDGERRGDGAAALGDRQTGRAGTGDERLRVWAEGPGPIPLRAEGAARGRPGPRGRRTAVEAQGSRVQSRGWSPRGMATAIHAAARRMPTSRVRPATRLALERMVISVLRATTAGVDVVPDRAGEDGLPTRCRRRGRRPSEGG